MTLVGVTSTVAGAITWVIFAAVDGPFLAGIAAIMTSLFTFIIGLLAMRQANKRHKPDVDAAAAWKELAEQLLREKLALEEKERERADPEET